MIKRYFIFSAVAIGFLWLASCSNSPKSQGEKLGQAYCDCQKEYAKEQEKAYQNFLVSFDSYGFKNRTDARQKWQDLQNEAKRKFEECNGKVEEKRKKVESEFPTDMSNLLDPKVLQKYQKNPQKYLKEFSKNQEKANEFRNVLRNAANQCDVPETKIDNSKIEEKILAIMPQKPDVENLKQNLINRRIVEQTDGYFGRGWAWQITSDNDIKSIKIDKEEKVGNDYELDVHLVLQKESQSQYEADLTLICVLGQEDNWKIDFIKTKDIHIVKTGRYDDCVTISTPKSYWGNNLQFTNNCDVNLIIGGQMLENNGEWTKFSTRVNANSTGNSSRYDKEYKIDFIERQ